MEKDLSKKETDFRQTEEDEMAGEEECDGESLCGGEGQFVESFNDPTDPNGYGERIIPCSCRASKGEEDNYDPDR